MQPQTRWSRARRLRSAAWSPPGAVLWVSWVRNVTSTDVNLFSVGDDCIRALARHIHRRTDRHPGSCIRGARAQMQCHAHDTQSARAKNDRARSASMQKSLPHRALMHAAILAHMLPPSHGVLIFCAKRQWQSCALPSARALANRIVTVEILTRLASALDSTVRDHSLGSVSSGADLPRAMEERRLFFPHCCVKKSPLVVHTRRCNVILVTPARRMHRPHS